jgi:hypothetical protein
MAISNEVVRGGGRNRGAVLEGGDEILPPPFSPACGSLLVREAVAWPMKEARSIQHRSGGLGLAWRGRDEHGQRWKEICPREK